MRAWILNDTSSYHAGCRSTMRALRAKIRGEIVGVTKKGDWAEPDWPSFDTLVCNGEGTLHHGVSRPWAKHVIAIMWAAECSGIRVCLVNALWQDNPAWWGGVLNRCFRVDTRDPRSLSASIRVRPNLPVLEFAYFTRCYPDLSLDDLKRPETPGPYRGKIVLGDVGCSGRRALWKRLESLGLPRVDLNGETLQDAVGLLAGCDGYLTGQWHGVVAATVAGVRFAAVESNSWKISAALAWSPLGLTVRTDEQMLAAARGEQDGFGGSRESFHEWSKFYCTLPRMPEIRSQ